MFDAFRSVMRALKLLRAVQCRFSVREFHGTASVCSKFHEGNVKSGYQKPDTRSPNERVRDGIHQLKDEIKLWKQEMKESLEMDVPIIRPGIPDKLWTFSKPEDLNGWTCTTDADNDEGYSSAQFHIGPNGSGIFEGYLSTKVPKEGTVKNTGYCSIRTKRAKKSFQRDSFWEWLGYTHVVMKVRGDGRSYVLNLGSAGHFDIMWNDMYQFILYTRGGPHWQYSKIPFSKFLNSSKGRIQDSQFPMHLAFVSRFGITLGDKVSGPFRLEIDWIGLEYDPKHTEDFAYEMYKTDKYVAHH